MKNTLFIAELLHHHLFLDALKTLQLSSRNVLKVALKILEQS